MSELQIERLALRVPGLTVAEGRRLAELIADGLASAMADGQSGSFGALRLTVTADPSAGVDRLAEAVLAELLRSLKLTL